jgi:hypothetical protein
VTLKPLPLAGVASSLVLFAVAAFQYPAGYDGTRDFISTLFAPTTPSGAVNAARPVAVVAMFIFCASVAVLFKIVSRRADTRWIASTLEIGGIGSMVYAFLVVTPMHDLLMAIALLFFLVAMLAALALTRREGRLTLFWAGLMALGLLLGCAVMYYGNLLGGLLPLAQKAAFASCVAWLLALQLAPWPARPGTIQGP